MEQERFSFIEQRDGLEKALEFAKLTYKLYRTSVLSDEGLNAKGEQRKFHHASTREYRRTFIESYLYLKRRVLNERLKNIRII